MLQEEFDQATDELIHLLSRFSKDQFNQSPYPGSWTAGQVGEHLFKTFQIVKLLQRQSDPIGRAPDQKVAAIREVMLDFETRRQAPDAVVPSSETLDKEVLMNSLGKRIAEFRSLIATTDLAEACPYFVLPQFGEFSKLEWVYFNLYHTQRHMEQLRKIADALGVDR